MLYFPNSIFFSGVWFLTFEMATPPPPCGYVTFHGGSGRLWADNVNISYVFIADRAYVFIAVSSDMNAGQEGTHDAIDTTRATIDVLYLFLAEGLGTVPFFG